MRVKEISQPPLTGTSTRMKSLPHVDISSIESHSEEKEQPFLNVARDHGAVLPLDQTLEVANRDNLTSKKCVYTYEVSHVTLNCGFIFFYLLIFFIL